MGEQMSKVNTMYLTDNYWKRTLGYCLVVVCSFALGSSFAVAYNGVNLILMIRDGWEVPVSLAYILLTSAFFVAGYVSLYTKRCVNRGYKFITVLDCILFICMVFVFLNYFRDNDVLFVLIIYGVLSLSGMLFYYRLESNQLEFIRYELLWPSLYVIALSAYIGYILSLSFVGKISDITFVVPLLVMLLYEYVLFLSNIPIAENEKNRIGIVHAIFLVPFVIWAIYNTFSQIAVIFLLFCGISMILEALDVIKRKSDEQIRSEYEAAMCFAICLLAGGVGGLVALMETISLQLTFLLIGMVEIYGVIFYIVWKCGYWKSNAVIDAIKLGAFITSIIFIIVLQIWEIDLLMVIGKVFSISGIGIKISACIGALYVCIRKRFFKENVLKQFDKILDYVIAVKKVYKVEKLFLYLAIYFWIGELILDLSIWAETKKEKLQVVILLIAAMIIMNSIIFVILEYKGREQKIEKKDKNEGEDSV